MTTHNHDVLMAINSRIINGRSGGAKQLNADYKALVKARDEIIKIRKALAEQPAQQEPVAHQYQSKDGVWRDFISQSHYKATVEDGSWPIRALYTFPPAQRTWVGLMDEEIQTEWVLTPQNDKAEGIWFGRRIEAKLKEKNT